MTFNPKETRDAAVALARWEYGEALPDRYKAAALHYLAKAYCEGSSLTLIS
jgi:hypothetical protein